MIRVPGPVSRSKSSCLSVLHPSELTTITRMKSSDPPDALGVLEDQRRDRGNELRAVDPLGDHELVQARGVDHDLERTEHELRPREQGPDRRRR